MKAKNNNKYMISRNSTVLYSSARNTMFVNSISSKNINTKKTNETI